MHSGMGSGALDPAAGKISRCEVCLLPIHVLTSTTLSNSFVFLGGPVDHSLGQCDVAGRAVFGRGQV